MTVTLRILGRLLVVDLRPRPLRPALRWNGRDQAHPVTFAAIAGQELRRFARALEASKGFGR